MTTLRILVELIGTFITVAAVLRTQNILTPLIAGISLSTALFITQTTNGLGQFNPVISAVLWGIGELDTTGTMTAVGAQLVGAIFAAWYSDFALKTKDA